MAEGAKKMTTTGLKKNKYMWSSFEFDNWCKQQTIELKKIGLSSSTAGVTRLLFNTVIIPNNIDISKVIKKELPLRKWKRKQTF